MLLGMPACPQAVQEVGHIHGATETAHIKHNHELLHHRSHLEHRLGPRAAERQYTDTALVCDRQLFAVTCTQTPYDLDNAKLGLLELVSYMADCKHI